MDNDMALLKEWQKVAYDETKDRGTLQRFWANYFNLEKGVYEKLLEEPDVEVKGTVKELAEKYGLSVMEMTGFLDGINESLVETNPIEEMEEDTVVSLKFDKEKLYKNMVDAKADWLYELPQWDKIFDKEKKHELYLEQKKSGTIVKGPKIGRNDPCPCGSVRNTNSAAERNTHNEGGSEEGGSSSFLSGTDYPYFIRHFVYTYYAASTGTERVWPVSVGGISGVISECTESWIWKFVYEVLFQD